MWSANVLSHSIGCLCILLMVFFAVQELLVWCSPLFLFLLLLPMLLVLYTKNLCQKPCQGAYPLCFLLEVLWFRFLHSRLHFELIFVYGIRKESSFILLHVVVQFSKPHLLKRLSFPHCIFLALLLQINWLYICMGLFLGSLFFSIYLCVCFYDSTLLFWLI